MSITTENSQPTTHSLRGTLRQARARRRARRQLERDVASVQTPGERAELQSMLTRATPRQAAEVKRALALADARRNTHQLFDH